jgi:phosphoribosylanthranilate isomerase
MDVRIKICGITNVPDAVRAAELGADMIGLNFYEKSPRFIDEATAKSILDAIPDSVEPVALFVDYPNLFLQMVTDELGICTVQNYAEFSEPRPIGCTRWFPAFRVADAKDLLRISNCLDLLRALDSVPDAIVVDAHVPGLYGGTGQTAPWNLLAGYDPGVPLILAGGLTPDNVAEAIRIMRPYAVDVASGVESAPGKKDREKMRRFVDAVRSAR